MTKVTHIDFKETNSPECLSCGSTKTTRRKEVDEFEYKHANETHSLSAEVDVYSCADCGFEFTDSSAEDARHNAVCEFLNVQPPKHVKAVRLQYGLTRAQMAEVSRIGDASLARWESGALIQSGAYDNYLYLLRYSENMERIQRRAHGESSGDKSKDKQWSFPLTQKVRRDQESFSLSVDAA